MAGAYPVNLRRTLIGVTLYIGILFSQGAFAQTLPEKPIDFAVLRDFFAPVDVVVQGAERCFALDVVVADTRSQQARGLMYVRFMPERSGMLFDYGEPRALSMWMKNTLIPLDIAFATSDGDIINVVRDTTPLSLASISAAAPAVYVLELNAGIAERLDIGPGSRLHIYR
ncbi:MAG: DUF192 domain-containing protein [Pseudomonadota bacterium]